jgi:hypothetical protein
MLRTLLIATCASLLAYAPAFAEQAPQQAEKEKAAQGPTATTPGSQTPKSAPKSNPLDFGKVRIGGHWYISYQYGNELGLTPNSTETFNRFAIKRGYLNIRADLQPWLEVRITPDVHQDSTGDLKVRLKYIYAKFKGKGNSIISKPYAEVGVAHMPWLDFEEHINRFRMQDTMFLERNGLFNSADIGFTLGSNFGPDLDDDYKSDVNDHYAGRYGSWQFGVYNGGGYHAVERNTNKAVEARGTLRPLPDTLPGLQFSLFGIYGKGNLTEIEPTDTLPDDEVLVGMVSYEHPYVALTAQWYGGEGNARGTAINLDDRLARSQRGQSYYGEVRFTKKRNLSFIGRYDRFNTDIDRVGSDLRQRLILGFAWQMFKNNYWLFDYDRLYHSHPDLADEDRIQVTLQISF